MNALTSRPAVSSAVLSGPGGAGTGVIASGADNLVVPSVTLPEFVLGQARQRGRGADPGRAAQLILELASGRGDCLSGRHLTVADDLDALLTRSDQIRSGDLHTLRLCTGAP